MQSERRAKGLGDPAAWWAYSEDEGWVILDRSNPCNRTDTVTEEFKFVRCSDWSTYQQGERRWAYREANRYLAGLAPEQAIAARRELGQLMDEFQDRTIRWS